MTFNLSYTSPHGTVPESKTVVPVAVENTEYKLYNGVKLPNLDPNYEWMILGGDDGTGVTGYTINYTSGMLYLAIPWDGVHSPVISGYSYILYNTADANVTAPRAFFYRGGELTDRTEKAFGFAPQVWDDIVDKPFAIERDGTGGGIATVKFLGATATARGSGSRATPTPTPTPTPPTPQLSYAGLPLWWTNSDKVASVWSNFEPKTTASDPEPIYDGYAYTLTAEDLPTLTADGYKHTGWTLADGTPVNVGDTIAADTELVAVWEADEPTVTVQLIRAGEVYNVKGFTDGTRKVEVYVKLNGEPTRLAFERSDNAAGTLEVRTTMTGTVEELSFRVVEE